MSPAVSSDSVPHPQPLSRCPFSSGFPPLPHPTHGLASAVCLVPEPGIRQVCATTFEKMPFGQSSGSTTSRDSGLFALGNEAAQGSFSPAATLCSYGRGPPGCCLPLRSFRTVRNLSESPTELRQTGTEPEHSPARKEVPILLSSHAPLPTGI